MQFHNYQPLFQDFTTKVLQMAYMFDVPADSIQFYSNYTVKVIGDNPGGPYLERAASMLGRQMTWGLSGFDIEDFNNPYLIA